jgi:hypothetical protein
MSSSNKSSSNKSSSKRTSEIPEMDKLRLEAVIPANNYELYLLIILLLVNKITKKADDIRKIVNFIVKKRDLRKVKNMLFGIFKTLNEQQKNSLINYINTIKEEEIFEKKDKICAIVKTFDIKNSVDIYIYLSKTNYASTFEYSPTLEGSSRRHLSRASYKTQDNTTTFKFLDELFGIINLNTDIIQYKTKINSFFRRLLEESSPNFTTQLLIKVLLFFELLKTKKISDNFLLFNKLFIDVEKFLEKDYEKQIIKYYLLFKSNINIKIRHILAELLPPQPSELSQLSFDIHSNLGKFSLISAIHIENKFNGINPRNIKDVFSDFIQMFLIEIIIYKKEIKLSKYEEETINQILAIIINILKDDKYHSDKYKRELAFLKEQTKIFNFFKYYCFTFVASVALNSEIIRYMTNFIETYILSLRNFKQTRRIDTSTISDPQLRAEMEELIRTPTEQRYAALIVYNRAFLERNSRNPEEIRKTFLEILMELYNGKPEKIANKFLYDHVITELFSKL